MGGVELGKIWLGRKDERAWVVGSIMPAGIFSIWRRCPYKGLRTALLLSAVGWAYQYSTNNNYADLEDYYDQLPNSLQSYYDQAEDYYYDQYDQDLYLAAAPVAPDTGYGSP